MILATDYKDGLNELTPSMLTCILAVDFMWGNYLGSIFFLKFTSYILRCIFIFNPYPLHQNTTNSIFSWCILQWPRKMFRWDIWSYQLRINTLQGTRKCKKYTAFCNYKHSSVGLDFGGVTGVMRSKVEIAPRQERIERSLRLEGTFVQRFAVYRLRPQQNNSGNKGVIWLSLNKQKHCWDELSSGHNKDQITP